MSNSVQIAASILSADFGHLADEAKRIEDAGADAIHVDIMDGHFVPNFSLGPRAVEAIRRSCKLFLDIHLMIYNPYDYVERFIEAGADQITFHFEATEDVEDTLAYIRKCHKKAGIAFNPETSVSMALPFLSETNLMLFMTVHPGFGGQKLIKRVLSKVRTVRQVLNQMGKERNKIKKNLPTTLNIQVDGGITEENAKECILAGANALVSGHYLWSQPQLALAIKKLRDAAL